MHGLVRRVGYTLTKTSSPSLAAVIGCGFPTGALGGALNPTTWTYASHPLLLQMPPARQGWMPTRANWLLPVEESSRAT